MAENAEFINPFDLFIVDSNDDDLQVRVESVKKLSTIAVVLGSERTRSELIPYLETFIEGVYSEDELLLNVADQLGRFLPLIGGPDYVHLLVQLLEKLAILDETVVREQAITSLEIIGSLLDSATLEDNFVPLILRLAESEWFTAKCSATGLFALCYAKSSTEHRAELRNAFRNLSQDECPLVRRTSALKLPLLANVLELDHLKDEFIPVFDNFAKDAQDSVRLLAVDIGVSIAMRLKKVEVEDYVFKAFNELFVDPSWRVRYQVANQINNIQIAIGSELTRKHLIALYQNLVQDDEPQVREVAAKNIVLFCKILQKTFTENTIEEVEDSIDPLILHQMLPIIRDLDQDINQDVKEALSSVITSLCPLLGPKNTKHLLLPIITTSLLNDSSKVRENIIANLNDMILIIGIADILETVLKIINELINNSVWRTRRNLVVTISYIAKHSGKEYFNNHLKPLYGKLLNDGVYAVRKTTPLILPVFIRNFGIAWAINSIVPELLTFAEHQHYLFRYVFLFCIDELVAPTLNIKYKRGSQAAGIKSADDLIYYLESFRTAVADGAANANVAKHLDRIASLNESLRIQLDLEWSRQVLQMQDENDCMDDDITRYAEDTIEMFLKDTNLNIFSLTVDEIKGEAGTYLEGVIELLVNNFLSILQKLAKDPVANVQTRVQITLKKIYDFSSSLGIELHQEWAGQREIPEELDLEMSKSVDIGDSSIASKKGVCENAHKIVSRKDDIEGSGLENITCLVADKLAVVEVGERLASSPIDKSMETEIVEILEEKLLSVKTKSLEESGTESGTKDVGDKMVVELE